MNEQPNQAGEQNQHQLVLQKIYLQDASLEIPNAPAIFMERWEPKIQVEFDSKTESMGQDNYLVKLRVTVTASLQEKPAFLIEAQQAGIFTIKGFSDTELGQVLGAYCPNALHPFVREVVSDMVTRAGFPQLLLPPVNFDAIYAQQVNQQQRQTVQ